MLELLNNGFDAFHAAMVELANWLWGGPKGWKWGGPVLLWLLGGGLVLTFASNLVQVRRLGYIIKQVLAKKTHSKDGISSRQALLAALSSTIGTGNIIGVAIGIVAGGPGAIFWMWVVGFVAMAIKYSEALASVYFRKKRSDGRYDAGPFMYIQGAFSGLNMPKLGKFLAVCYAISMATILISAGAHTGALVDNLEKVELNRLLTTIILMAVVFIVVVGGLKSLVKITDKMVPFMTIVFMLASAVILVINYEHILPTFALIFKCAFSDTAAIGGFAGASVQAAIRWGCARGMYSSDAGNGVTSILHGQADVKHPVEQAICGVFEVFFDTIIVCTFTALVILTSDAWQLPGLDGSTLTQAVFSSVLGTGGKYILVLTVVLFGLSSLLSFTYFVYEQAKMLTGSEAVAKICQIVFLVMMYIGGMKGVKAMIVFADVGNAIKIALSMSALIVLSKLIYSQTNDYFKDK